MNIKDLFIDFFVSKGHKQIPSAPIVPENDPSVLFNTAGMQPLVPYLMGQPHPYGKRLCDYQKCMRTNDLDEIGDRTHHTFFEMLGNWSLGDYFKEESIKWSFEFLTEHLNIPVNKLAVTVFKGNDLVNPDNESYELWQKQGIPKERIAFLGESDNWWAPGDTGPCGPDTEIFYWSSSIEPPLEFDPNDDNWVEIWNNVFMEYNHLENGEYEKLVNKNVDTGMGVERITAVLEGKHDNYQTSIWKNVINKIEEISGEKYFDKTKEMRIIADHIRSIVFISADEAKIIPSNTDQGYILRRLIRRMLRYAKKINIDINSDFELQLAKIIIEQYKKYYSELEKNEEQVMNVLKNEKNKFSKTLEKGLKEFEKSIKNIDKKIDASLAFKLYDTYGFPIELTVELAFEHNLEVDVDGFKQKFKEHQEKSRKGMNNKFKGGLSSNSDMDIKYHTATHLLNAALKVVLGSHVHQMGSNITPERLRFDFSHDSKLTKEQIQKTQDLVNKWINDKLDVSYEIMPKDKALKSGAECMFIERYPDEVTVYSIGDISKELCGGPHVKNTSELGEFIIKKEESSQAGVRRIKAILK